MVDLWGNIRHDFVRKREDALFFLYLLLWLIFSLRLSAEIVAIGIIISAAVYWFACSHLRYKPASDIILLKNFLIGLQYVVILVWETAKANVAVFRIVFNRTIRVDPCIIYFNANLKTNIARVVLANSITLTPGTITITLNDDLFCVHCLNREMAQSMEDSVFVRQLRKFES